VECVTNCHWRGFSLLGALSLSFTSYKPNPLQTAISKPIHNEDVALSVEESGDGVPVVLLHGLTATRRYVVHGSRYLSRHGFRVVQYDARGHGESGAPSDSSAYEYSDLCGDLGAVVEGLGMETVVLVGHSMGAATAVRFALESPSRVAALVQITPAYDGERSSADLDDWNALADGLEASGVEGFMDAYDPAVSGEVRETVLKFTRQRLERHRDLSAVAAALRVVPASEAFPSIESLQDVAAPTLVVGSRDESDPGHPWKVAEAYSEYLPNAELIVEDEGKPPVAWQGAQLSKAIAAFLERQGIG
jgi:pimeloyl-ACP methyl ester carboxylesterase